MIFEFLVVITPFLHTLGVLHAAHALMRVRTSQGTIAWVVSLVAIPYLSIPCYWVFGRDRFRGYVDARRKYDWPEGDDLGDMLQKQKATYNFGKDHSIRKVSEAISGLPLTEGNKTTLLINGEKTFLHMFDAIGRAQDYILVLFFIVKGDRMGVRFKDVLIDKAKSGIRVYFMYDEVGSRKLPKGYISELSEAGVHVVGFGTTRGRGNRFQLNFRNHRKIIVVDGEEALVGGLNIGDEYVGNSSQFGDWRDTHLAIKGPAVNSVQLVFVEDWHWATGDLLDLHWDMKEPKDEGKRVLILPPGPADDIDSCHVFFMEAMCNARKRLWIASPYFVPDEAIVAALQAAALRGVDVRILLPDKPDQILVYLSSFSYLKEMYDGGVKVYRYQKGFLHQKVMVIDDELATVGTANLDNRSFRLNFEIIAMVDDRSFNQEVAEMLEADFAVSRQVNPGEVKSRPLWFRVAVAFARLLAPIQ